MLTLVVYAAVASGKDNFFLSGDLEGVADGDAVVIEYMKFEPGKKTVRKEVRVKDGHFEFSTHLNNAWKAQLRLKSVKDKRYYGLPVFIVPDERLELCGDIADASKSHEVEVGGSEFYRELAEVRKFARPYLEEIAAARSEAERMAAAERYSQACQSYVMARPDSEAAYSLVGLTDTWALAAVENMTERVRKGRFGRKIAQDVKVMQMLALQRYADRSKPRTRMAQNEKMPPFELRSESGKKFHSDSLAGKYTVIDFWGSWCIWCIRGIPKMKKYYERYAGELQIVSIACSDREESWRSALKKHRMEWPQLISDDGLVEKDYNVRSFPTKVVISPEGVVLRTFRGEGEDFYDYLDGLLGK